ncbi:MAG: calcium-binding protein [Leptolyngbya sp. SIO4C1]|nr:calcium-binding protein [Leptolyngbya sp. SIO4C1]
MDGNELAANADGAAPGEDFSRDPYLEFTAAAAGTYYVGVSQLGNRNYDPNVARSGSGWVFPEAGVFYGPYELTATLTADNTPGTDITGTDAADTLIGDASDNTIDALAGDDTVAGDLGNDIITGGGDDDILRGDLNSRATQGGEPGGNDIIFGGEGNDRIGGKAGDDILSGDAGDDFIWGDDGNDILMGVTGDDILVGDNFSGGSGSDLFVFGNGDGTDTILDFEVGIDLIGLVEGELTFTDLTITQDGSNALLGVASSGETLAVLNGVQASSLTENSFEIVADVSNPEEALALI